MREAGLCVSNIRFRFFLFFVNHHALCARAGIKYMLQSAASAARAPAHTLNNVLHFSNETRNVYARSLAGRARRACRVFVSFERIWRDRGNVRGADL